MLHDAGHRVARLGLELRPQRFVLGVRGAREQEVLPDQHAELITQVVEVVGLVDATAPDPQEIEVRVDGIADRAAQRLAGDAREERVIGDPVGAADVDVLAVDADGEGAAVGIRCGVELDGAESDAAGPGFLPRAHRDVVERLGAVSARPPEFSLRHLDRDHDRRGAGCDIQPGRVPTRDRRRDADRLRARLPLEVDLEAHDASGAVRDREWAHGGEAHPGPAVDADRLPDAGGHDIRSPVPTEVARGLADRVEGVVVDVRAGAEQLLLLAGVLDRRAEGDDEVVVGVGTQEARDIPAVRPVLVLRARHLGAVEHDGGDRVESLGHEIAAVVGCRDPEARRVAPVDEPDPGERGLVVLEVRIGDESGREQIGVHDARHGRRDAGGERPDEFRRHRTGRGAKDPTVDDGGEHGSSVQAGKSGVGESI